MFSKVFTVQQFTHCDDKKVESGASPGQKQWGGQKARVELMASVEREPITGVRGRSPLKLKAFCGWTTQTRGKICHF